MNIAQPSTGCTTGLCRTRASTEAQKSVGFTGRSTEKRPCSPVKPVETVETIFAASAPGGWKVLPGEAPTKWCSQIFAVSA